MCRRRSNSSGSSIGRGGSWRRSLCREGRMQPRCAGGLTGTEHHAVPVGQAKTIRQAHRRVKGAGGRESEREYVPERLDMARELGGRQLALIAPPAELLCRLAKHLPEQNRWLWRHVQLIQQLLSLEPLHRLVVVD